MCQDSQPPPDYTAMAEATAESAQIMADLGRDQLAETKRQYDITQPIMSGIANKQLDIMKQTADQGADYYDYMKETYRPVEKSLVDDVNNYNTEANRERMASEAATDVAQADKVQRDVSAREMARMGVNPNSGKYQALDKSRGLRVAGMRAGAMTNARNRAKELGYAKKLDVIGVGRGLPGASTSAYGTAVGAGNAAGGTTMAPANFMLRGMNTAGGYTAGGANIRQSGASSILNAQGGAYAAGQGSGLMDVVGMGIGGWAGGGFSFGGDD